MDPIIDSDWLGCKSEPVDESQHVGNIARSWQWRGMGINPPQGPSNKTVLENIAEDILVQKPLKTKCCDLPGYPRSTFLMVFSPDATKVASTHGNHNVYVSELASGKHVRILKGHPRTPWCIAFHPSHPQLIGSGCLGGQVRVWDLSGGSEVWTVGNETVISSIAFHPRDQLLVIATFNELYFWDWSQPAPFTKVSTNNINEKVRYVAFDSLGYKLITGISVSSTAGSATSILQNSHSHAPTPHSASRRDAPGDRPRETSGTAQEMIVNSYQNLVQRYDSLVRNYQRLFMARHQLTSTPPANTTDRGTDPMEQDRGTDPMDSDPAVVGAPSSSSTWSYGSLRASESRDTSENDTTPVRPQDGGDSGDGEGSSSRLLNLDVLSINSNPSRTEDSNQSNSPNQERSLFGSSSSAFQRLNDGSSRARSSERTTRWLPNPFSATSGPGGRHHTVTFSSGDSGTSRTSVFTSHRLDSPSARFFLQRRRHLAQQHTATSTSPPPARPARPAERRRPTANSSTQISPVAAQTINESLDLIRDILRDSGTRLLNLITNMSLNTLASVERGMPRRGAQSDDSEGAPRGARPRHQRPRVRLFSSSLRHEFLSSETDSDSDQALEVNLIRARHSIQDTPDSRHSSDSHHHPTNRMVVELNVNDDDVVQNGTSPDSDSRHRFNITVSNNRFRVRSHSTDENPEREARRGRRDSPRASTSRAPPAPARAPLSAADAFRKVRAGELRRRVLALQRARRGAPQYYTRPLLERCRYLSELSAAPAPPDLDDDSQHTTLSTDSTSSSVPTEPEQGPSARRPRRADQLRALHRLRSALSPRRRAGPEPRRRPARPPRHARPAPRAAPRPAPRSFELHCTRNEIRMRAMQVLSIMFNMMMSCLEERGLSQLIIHMLRTLKKALALTCLMLMTNRLNRRDNEGQDAPSPAPRGEDPPAAIQDQPPAPAEAPSPRDAAASDDAQPVENNTTPEINTTTEENGDGNNDSNSTSSWPTSDSDDDEKKKKDIKNNAKKSESAVASTSGVVSSARPPPRAPAPRAAPRVPSHLQRWSNRLAVQISAANRNTSATARSRRDLYLESRRLKALHRTNPNVHPIAKRKVFPPATSYRIPAVRRLPTKRKPVKPPPSTDEHGEPVAGPSGSQPGPSREEPARQHGRGDSNEFDSRINLFRIAHMQAVRLRTAARSRLRRLQTIRLYPPSSVREMFAIQSNNADTGGQGSGVGEPGRRPFAAYRPHIISGRLDTTGNREPRQFDQILNNVAVPLVQVNDLPVGEGGGAGGEAGARPQRMPMPRVHDYLQPIILAQNALVVEEGGGGGLGGFLDAGLVSEAVPAPTYRVQAWDFTTGDTPDIADSTKNVVVQRCRIHNDASIDISKDGRLLVALLPVPRLRHTNHWLGVYSLEWGRLGQCLHTAVLEQSAVSVALSPTARHLAVGLGSRRFTTLPHARNNVFALLYRLSPLESSSRTGLSPIKELEQNWEQGFTSLNCLRWAPQPGQGLVYANNTGQLIIMS
ncbi:unnamed protein product [Plutella xylostella]|uniref:(diamondback moth) hypothetical protein n=1 Tax=Plutella xylostella TaxID=51655 RepID=A0A8S4DF22_PLUXY|nr:unnamed protein product [Plutella xylostella]